VTRLKCKPCKLFYEDDGSVSKCANCGGDLKRITVHALKIKSLTVHSKAKTKGQNDKHKER